METAASSLCETMLANGPRMSRQMYAKHKGSPATGVLQEHGVVLIGEWQFPCPIEKDIVEILELLGAVVWRIIMMQCWFSNVYSLFCLTCRF